MNTPILLDGKLISANIKEEIRQEVAKFDRPITLGSLLVGDDTASQKYVGMKHKDCEEVGINSYPLVLSKDASIDQIFRAIDELNEKEEVDGYIVQLPLPKGIDQNLVLDRIDPKKDSDGLHPTNLGKLVLKVNEEIDSPLPCTPKGIVELLKRYSIDFDKKEVTIIGRGTTVGRPLGLLLTRRENNATVNLVHSATLNIQDYTKRADIIISAIGSANYIKEDMIKDNAIIVDVGVSRDSNGKISGDFDKECYKKSYAYTPNPGGIGPMTRVMLLKNTLELSTKK